MSQRYFLRSNSLNPGRLIHRELWSSKVKTIKMASSVKQYLIAFVVFFCVRTATMRAHFMKQIPLA